MSRVERLQRYGLRGMMVLALWCLGAVTVRAVVTARARSAAAAQTRLQVEAWHWQIGEEMPMAERQAWREVSRGNPEQLLRACSLEHTGTGE